MFILLFFFFLTDRPTTTRDGAMGNETFYWDGLKKFWIHFLYPFLRRLKLGKSLQTDTLRYLFLNSDAIPSFQFQPNFPFFGWLYSTYKVYFAATFSSNDGDGNANVKKAIDLIKQNKNVARAARFMEDVSDDGFFFSFWVWIWCLGIYLRESSPKFDKASELELSRWILKEYKFSF